MTTLKEIDIPMNVISETAKWYSVGYTPSFKCCPSCKKSIGYHPADERCWNCNQKLIWN